MSFPSLGQRLRLVACSAALLLGACHASDPAPAAGTRPAADTQPEAAAQPTAASSSLRAAPASPALAPLPAEGTAQASATPAACGSAGQAECPTQRWMKSTLQAYLRTHDYKRLEASFNDLAAHAPQSFQHWESLARSGARAAASHDEPKIRQSCQSCHDSYRAEFRRELRSVQLM